MTPMERIEGELSDAQKRIAELERRNVGLAKECQAQQEQITELKNALTRQASAARRGMDAAKRAGSHMEAEARRITFGCSPAALESEREANAKLTNMVADLEHERDAYRAAEEAQIALRQKADEREAALAAHVERLKSALDNILSEIGTYSHDDISDDERKALSALEATPGTSLPRRDLLKQAEVLEAVAAMIKSDATNAMHGYAMHRAASIALSNAVLIRQQAEALT